MASGNKIKLKPKKQLSRIEILEKKLHETTFYVDPASTKYHLNIVEGLSIHSDDFYNNLMDLTRHMGLVWQEKDSPYIIAKCHDLCKIGAYINNGDGTYSYNPEHPTGHGSLSLEIAKSWIELTEEEELCIRWHMGAFDAKENWNQYTAAIRLYPNVLWAHTADMMATHIDEKDMVY
jgi:hypothetical protein